MIITNNLKSSAQADKATKTANSVLAQIKNSFTYFEAETVRLLYVALVRPHLEFAISVWNPYFRKDMDKLKKHMHKATRLVPILRNKLYNFRLSQLNLTSLETKRQRGDLIQFYKILNKLDQVKWLKEPEQVVQNDELGPAANLREDVCFYRSPGKVCTARN